MELKEREKLFAAPSREYRGKPFWSWNGRLEEKELMRQADNIKKMGFGGFFMHSRTGLETEYLGQEWFDLTNKCADYAAKEGMEAWLYDEDRWPSGSAGGLVTKEEKARMMYMVLELAKTDEELFNLVDEYDSGLSEEETDCTGKPGILAVFACKVDEDELFTDKRSLSVEELRKQKETAGSVLAPGETALLVRIKYMNCSDNYNGYCYVDTMNKESIEKYIDITHESYKKNCGDKFGKEILGVFTDEPHRGGMFTDFSGEGERACPYTRGMMAEFEKRFGYSMAQNLPEVFLRKEKGEISKVTRDYFELCQELFLEAFAQPIYKWCKENNMIFTGHVLHEDTLCCQAVMQGSLMRFYEYMEYPGIDLLGEKTDCYWIAKQISSVARQLNKEWVLSELYGCTGWQMNFESYKNIGDWQALLGINLRCPHLSWYTMKGEAKRDYPASIFHQSPWYEDWNYLESYYSRIHVALHNGKPECRLLVVSPIESVWSRAYSGAFSWLFAKDEELVRLEKQYVEVFHGLMDHRIDFDYGEEDICSRHARVENGILYVGNAAYSKVLVAGVDTMRASTLALLKEFASQGGEVIFAGEIPGYVDSEKSDLVKEFAAQGVDYETWKKTAEKNSIVCIPWEEDALVSVCRTGHEIGVWAAEEGQKPVVFAQSFEVEGGRMVMLLNMDRDNGASIKVDLGEGSYVERWDPRSGMAFIPDYEKKDGRNVLTIDLEKGGERLYFLTEEERELPREEKLVAGGAVMLPDTFAYQLSEPNICVLDKVSVEVYSPDDSGKLLSTIPEMEVLKADRKLRDLFEIPYRGGEMLQPWYEVKYYGGNTKLVAPLTLHFGVQSAELPKGVELVVEELEHMKEIRVNGTPIALTSTGKWIDVCFEKLAIPDEVWKEGANEIDIDFDYYKTSGLEAVYLLGDFGVVLTPGEGTDIPVLNSLPEKLHIGDISVQGLPFYSGKVTYLMDQLFAEDEELVVEVESFGGSLVKLIGAEENMLAFPPLKGKVNGLKAVEVVLTRRNTFGPLHQYPKLSSSYGPGNFMTEGDAWKEEYQLLEQGLLKPLKVAKLSK